MLDCVVGDDVLSVLFVRLLLHILVALIANFMVIGLGIILRIILIKLFLRRLLTVSVEKGRHEGVATQVAEADGSYCWIDG